MQMPLFMLQTQSSECTPMQDILQLWRKKFSASLNLTNEGVGEGTLVVASSMAELDGGARIVLKSERYSTLPLIWLNPKEGSITYFSSPDIALFHTISAMHPTHKQTGELPAII